MIRKCFSANVLFVLFLSAMAEWNEHTVRYTGPVSVQEGYPFTITCIVKRSDYRLWTVDGTVIPSDNDAGYVLSEKEIDTFHLMLTLHSDSAQMYHEGDYRCSGFSRDYHALEVLQTDHEEEEEGDFEIEEDEDEEEKQDSSDRILRVNETIKLLCTSAKDDNSPIQWYKNGRRISPNAESNVVIKKKYLTINEAQEENAGEYMCTVDLTHQTGLSDIGRIFQIKSPARISSYPKWKSVMFGRTLTLMCKAEGFPTPKITWYINNILLKDLMEHDPRIWVYTSGNNQQYSHLTIRDVDFFDKGLYTCIAENSLDNNISVEKDEDSVFISIRENMIETNEDEPGMGKIMVPGEDLVLQCNTTECPQCRVVWFKDGHPVTKVHSHLTIDEDTNSLLIHQASYDDGGTYMCAIDREQLDIALNATIIVQSEVKLTKFETTSQFVIQGKPLELYCLARGSPKPHIKWFKGGEEISSSHKRIKFLEHNSIKNSKLMIEEANYEDRDQYTCVAFNQVNSLNTTIFIRIKDRLAALWPFLGICIEVAILCTIIFIHERRKSQLNENETDLPTENRNRSDQKNTDNTQRQRKLKE